MTFVFMYVTCRNEPEAAKIATVLLQKKLIACANIFPINSLYRWKGRIRKEKEVVMILKTLSAKASAVKKEIEKIHSYEIPCITEIKIKPNKEYGGWLKEQFL